MAGRTEKLFKLGVCFYIAGLSAALCGVALVSRAVRPAMEAEALGPVLCVVGVGFMAAGWILRKNTRSG